MAFSASRFIFNDVMSDKFGLYITSINSGGENDNPLITNSEFIVQQASGNSKVYQLGSPKASQLTFPIEFFSESPIYVYDREQIALWLLGDGKFKKLRIIQDDMNSIYYNCYFSKIDWTNIRNVGYGFKGIVVCDAPFAWKSLSTIVKTNQPIGGTQGDFLYPEITRLIVHNNSTDYNPISPTIKISLGDNNNQFRVINESNMNEFFQFSGLQNGEEISITSDLIISSITNPNKLIIDNFSGEFLELVRGKNKILIEGQIKEFIIQYHQSKYVGG